MPYGFPSGAELRFRICFMEGHAVDLQQALYSQYGTTEVEQFKHSFRGSHIASIDAFLAKRPEFSTIGKYAIAHELCKKEIPEYLGIPVIPDDDWYFRLWNALMADVHNLEQFRLNNIKIVTFNYDRSLEAYLDISIQNTFKLSPEDSLKEVQKMKIIHVYGSLGNYGFDSINSRGYHPDVAADKLHVAAKGIRVIPETRDDDIAFNEVYKWFYTAARVVILGFGFDDLNVKRLGFAKALSDRAFDPPVEILASTWGMSEAEAEVARIIMIAPNSSRCIWKTSNARNLETLRNNAGILR